MTTTIGILILLAAAAFLPTNPGYSALLVVLLVAFDRLIGWGEFPGKDWPAAIVVTLAVGGFIYFSGELLWRCLTA